MILQACAYLRILQAFKHYGIKNEVKNMKLKTLCSVIITTYLASLNANASDLKNWRSPHFTNLERVYIHLDYDVMKEEESKLPEFLHRESIKRTIKSRYTERLSSEDCNAYFETRFEGYRNPDACNDQPITILEWSSSFWKGGREYEPLTDDNGTLVVVLRVEVMDQNIDMQYRQKSAYDPDLIVFSYIQYRPDQHEPLWRWNHSPAAYRLDLDNDILEKSLEDYIMFHIQ